MTLIEFIVGIAAIATIIGAIYGGYKWSYKRGYSQAKLDISDNHYKLQYEKIYAPLRAHFLGIQVTSVESMAFPYVRQRIKRAFRLLKEGKVKKAISAIKDKGISGPNAEIEFGPGFPLRKIKELLAEHSHLADSEIMNLYQCADRAQYESQIAGGRGYDHELLAEEYKLFLHIMERYQELSGKYG